MNALRAAAFAVTCVLVQACGPDLAVVDEGDVETSAAAGALCSSADVDGLTERSADAVAVLRVANSLDLATLRSGPRLTRATAQNVVTRRDGPDARHGTADDQPFTSLKDLSSVCGVGSSAIHSLLLWGQAHPEVDAGTPIVDAGTVVVDAGTPAVDAGTPDPWPTCSGAPRFPVTGDLVLQSGSQTTWTRTCDSWGTCTAWAQEGTLQSISQFNGPRSLLITTGGGVYLQAQIGWTTSSTSGSDTYLCQDYDTGSANLDAHGVGAGLMRSGYQCNIAGGSGGPYGEDPQRTADFTLGATCLSVTDRVAGPSYGVQRVRVQTYPY